MLLFLKPHCKLVPVMKTSILCAHILTVKTCSNHRKNLHSLQGSYFQKMDFHHASCTTLYKLQCTFLIKIQNGINEKTVKKILLLYGIWIQKFKVVVFCSNFWIQNIRLWFFFPSFDFFSNVVYFITNYLEWFWILIRKVITSKINLE